MPRSRSRRLLLATLPVVGVAILVAAAYVVDWLTAMPAGRTATYVGRAKCAECHQKETDLWRDSDHDLAMDQATPQTVLGDFENAEFTHIAFDDLIKLTDTELAEVVRAVPLEVWTVALTDAQADLRGAVFAKLSEEARREAAAAIAWLEGSHDASLATESDKEPSQQGEAEFLAAGHRVVRPCDVTDAQQAIGDAARRLAREGRISLDFALKSKMTREGDQFFITTDNRLGEMEKFPIKYVFGVRPLQQYLVEFPDGRIQCLPITWDTERRHWYHLYPKEPIPHDDPLHWTRSMQNWNYMCAECHTTNLEKNFDLDTNTYRTTWSEIDVSCETCHGPGSLHVELAEGDGKFGFWDRRYRYGLPNLKDENSRVQIENCAPCHSRRRIVYPNDHSSPKYMDYYLPEILDNNLYYADGQVLEEDYVYGSFIQSKMYDNNVRCADCHDPHSVKVKFNDNRLCTQCHTKAQYDTVLHHFHPDSTKPGTLCVECHMPDTKYMVADPRRDHSLRVPRPDLTVALGIPNACNGCHHDRGKGETAQWATDQVRTWYGEKRGQEDHFAYGIAAGRALVPEGEMRLARTARDPNVRATVRASAVSLLSGYGSSRALAEAIHALEDEDPLVRATAVRSLQYAPGPELFRRLAPMLHDPVRAVRVEAARLLAQVPRSEFNQEDLSAFDAALEEYRVGQGAVADQAAAHLNLAVVDTNLAQAHFGAPGRPDPKYLALAEKEYRIALRIEPDFIPARINLAMLCDSLGRKDEAESLFRKVVELDPELAEAHYSLGLLMAEDESRMEEAVGFLGRAAELSLDNARIHYNYGLALQKLDRWEESEKALLKSVRISGPSEASLDARYALALLYARQGQWDRATACAEQLVRIQPHHPQWQQFLENLRAQVSREAPSGPPAP
ncbi:MAG: tetratricopeptide repeat protein [Planctomycetaceae bacterium]|nr:tetratricopeptide repeat protein [Planctomycetaceae bacterium]